MGLFLLVLIYFPYFFLHEYFLAKIHKNNFLKKNSRFRVVCFIIAHCGISRVPKKKSLYFQAERKIKPTEI